MTEPLDFERVENKLLALSETGRYAQAEALTRRALARTPDDPDLLGWLASTIGQQDRHDEALEVLDRALALAPDDDRLQWIRSRVLHRAGRADEALTAAAETTRLDPQEVQNLQSEAAMLGANGRHREARDLALRALELDPENGYLHGIVGVCERSLRDYAAAERSLTEALRLLPDEDELWNELGLLYMVMGRVRPSLDAYVGASRANPGRDMSTRLAWPWCVVFNRSRWTLPLAAVLALVDWGVASRVAAGVLALACLVDAVTWPVRGGSVAWRGVRMVGYAHQALIGFGTLWFAAAGTLVVVSAVTGSTTAGVVGLVLAALLWVLIAVDYAVENDELGEGSFGLDTVLAELLLYIGYDFSGLAHRFRTLLRR